MAITKTLLRFLLFSTKFMDMACSTNIYRLPIKFSLYKPLFFQFPTKTS